MWIWKSLKEFDLLVIENVFQPIGFWSQRNFAVTALKIARACIWTFGISLMVTLGLHFYPELTPKHILSLPKDSLFLFIAIIVLLEIPIETATMKSEELSTYQGKFSNAEKIMPIHRFMRISSFWCSPILLNALISFSLVGWRDQPLYQYLLGIFITAKPIYIALFFHFNACDTGPPGESRIASWLKS